MKIPLICFVFLIFSASIFGYQISGTIADANTNSPIEFATIYINGTTIATLSDSNGEFNLSYDLGSCQVVVSHMSYQNQILELNRNSILNIKLVPKVIPIQQVSIENKNLRTINMRYFEEIFLGKDFWGENATIRNDSVISFIVKYYDEETPDSSLIGKMSYFEARASAPLRIDLTLLGYSLEYDLVKFIDANNEDVGKKILNMLGYNYFVPIEPRSKLQSDIFKRNRQMAFYNSPMHFMRCLFENKLSENGYLLYQIDSSNGKYDPNNPFDIERCNCISHHSNEAYLTGLKGNKFFLTYYGREKIPVNLEKVKHSSVIPKYSQLYILEDSCIIRQDGTLPGGQLVFSKNIVEKRIGAYLPSNYVP